MSKQQLNPIQAERKIAQTMDLRNQVIPLIIADVFYVAWLLLPQAAGLRGFQIITFSAAARETMSIAEFVFAILATLGVGICTTLVLITRKAVFGLVGWMFVTVGFAYSLFMVWMRGTRTDSAEIGMWCGIIAVAIATVSYSLVALRRSPEQLEAAQRAREAAGELDSVGQAQMDIRKEAAPEVNHLLVDDRRARAAERHQDVQKFKKPREQKQDAAED